MEQLVCEILKRKRFKRKLKFSDRVWLNKKYRIFKTECLPSFAKMNLWFPELGLRNLRPELIKEFPFGKDDLIKVVNNKDKVFYKIDEDSLMRSTFCNWVFTDLDRT